MSARKAPTKQERVFISDCEGPISKNDNAFEITSHIIPNGSRLFATISRYDDIQADIVKRRGYKAGDTLKLILPFLRAYGLSNSVLAAFSSRNLLLMPGAKEMLESVNSSMPSYIVSTSYQQYMHALCDAVGFPFGNVRCTQLDLDGYQMDYLEKAEVKRLAEEITELPTLEIPGNTRSLEDSPKKLQNKIRRLDEIFWEELPSMKASGMMLEVNPIGGSEKAAVIADIASELGLTLDNVMYVGDSITDVEAFRLIRQGGGLTLAFNGNSFAVREAEVAALSESALTTAVIAEVFNSFGKDEVVSVTKEWKRERVEELDLHMPLKESFLKSFKREFPRVEVVTSGNMERLMQESSSFRRSVRSEAIGRLG